MAFWMRLTLLAALLLIFANQASGGSDRELSLLKSEVKQLRDEIARVKGALEEIGEKHPARKIAEIIAEREKFLEDQFGKELDVEEKKLMAGM